MAERVAEGRAVTRLGDHAARRGVHLVSAHTRLARGDARKLGVQHGVVHGLHLVGHMADRDRARHIRAVAVHDAAKVHGDKIARLDLFFGRHAVRLGTIGARNHNRVKGHILRPIVQHQIGQPRGDLLFGRARPDVVQHFFERLLSNALRGDDLLDLVVFLAQAQLPEAVLQPHGGRVQRGCPSGVVRIGQHPVLQCDTLDAVLLDQFVDRRGVALAADLMHLKIADRGARRLDIAEIREKHRLFGR